MSASGAKILVKERPALGAEISLSFRPPGRRPVATRALVWRVDPDGLACMFVGTQEAEFLAAVAPRTVSAPRTPPPATVAAPVSAAPVSAVAAPVAAPPLAAVASALVAPSPRAAVAPAPVAPPPAASPTRSGGSVLVAASDTGLRALAIAGLERSGYAVLDAGSQPLLALRMAEQHGGAIALALIAADLKLMNGEPLAGRLTPLLPAAKLVLMASRTSPSPSTPGALWLPTPCSDAEMMAAVRQALAG